MFKVFNTDCINGCVIHLYEYSIHSMAIVKKSLFFDIKYPIEAKSILITKYRIKNV